MPFKQSTGEHCERQHQQKVCPGDWRSKSHHLFCAIAATRGTNSHTHTHIKTVTLDHARKMLLQRSQDRDFSRVCLLVQPNLVSIYLLISSNYAPLHRHSSNWRCCHFVGRKRCVCACACSATLKLHLHTHLPIITVVVVRFWRKAKFTKTIRLLLAR